MRHVWVLLNKLSGERIKNYDENGGAGELMTFGYILVRTCIPVIGMTLVIILYIRYISYVY